MNIPPKYEDVVAKLEAAMTGAVKRFSFTAQTFGAIGNGITDCTFALQHAGRYVSESDFEAALAREAALTKDLSTWKQKACEAAEREAALQVDLRNWKEKAFRYHEDREDLQQRLTVAEQQSRDMSVAISSVIKAAVFHRGVVEIDTNAYHALEDALKPAAEVEGS